jgi:hypothetical protein
VLVQCFMSWTKISQKCSILISNVVHKFVYMPVSEHFPIAKIIHPTDRCGISRIWLNSMIITQVHLLLGTIKCTLKCGVYSHNTMPQMSQVEGACNWHADCRNIHQNCCQRMNVHFSTISHTQRNFWKCVSMSNRPHNRRPRVWRCVGERFADVNIVNSAP